MCSQILLNKVVKRQFSRNAIWTGTPGKLLFWANDSPVWLRNWRSDFLHSYLIVCELFSSSLSLKNVIFCSILLCYDTFYRKIFTNIVYECLVCTTTSKKHNFNIFFKNETPQKTDVWWSLCCMEAYMSCYLTAVYSLFSATWEIRFSGGQVHRCAFK